MKITIDPLYNALYADFFVKGLLQKFGKANICFSRKPFLELKNRGGNFDFVIENAGVTVRYSIDHADQSHIINTSSYDWCDVYGKVNTNWQKTPKVDFPKLVSLVQNFGMRAYNNFQTVTHLLDLLLFKVKFNETNIKKLAGKHKRLWQNRAFLEDYEKCPIYIERERERKDFSNYIFHLSTLWYSDEWNKNDENVNRIRANFVRICKENPNINFEGGLLPQHGRSSEEKFKDVIFQSNRQMSVNEYLTKTKKSLFVFNTPSFWNCHGWKLGEYLAMGKAIISTPLFNDLPAPLEHGKHIHFLKNDSLEEMKNAINLIMNDCSYRKKLETAAKNYWQQYGTPEKSLELLVGNDFLSLQSRK